MTDYYGTDGDDVFQNTYSSGTYYGGPGDDLYYISWSGDDYDIQGTIVEYANEGIDEVRINLPGAGSVYQLPDFVENVRVVKGGLPVYGNALDNHMVGRFDLYGEAGNDYLQGGYMYGGSGDDTYVVNDTSANHVFETSAADGIDTVISYTRYVLGQNLENLLLKGSLAITGTGNALDNYIQGNLAANLLDGRAGADTIRGGDGDDTYVVDNALDVLIESATGGIDTVRSSVDWTLEKTFENLSLAGSAIHATGNDYNNVIRGNDANNVINGNGGADDMDGGKGNDTYFVDNVGDKVAEGASSSGIDRVMSYVSFHLSARIENLTLTRADSIDGTGNALANTINGNIGNNVLRGADGTDTLFGDDGNDHLFGDAGHDNIRGGDGNDWIYGGLESDHLTGGTGSDRFVSTRAMAKPAFQLTTRSLISSPSTIRSFSTGQSSPQWARRAFCQRMHSIMEQARMTRAIA